MAKRKTLPDRPTGSTFNPLIAPVGFRVRFPYDGTDGFYDVELLANGELSVRSSGSFSDMLSVRHHVGNDLSVIARRWVEEKGCHVEGAFRPDRKALIHERLRAVREKAVPNG